MTPSPWLLAIAGIALASCDPDGRGCTTRPMLLFGMLTLLLGASAQAGDWRAHRLTLELATGLAMRSTDSVYARSWAVSEDVEALYALDPDLLVGISVGVFDATPGIETDCSCGNPDGASSLHGGISLRHPWQFSCSSLFIQVNAHADVEWLHFKAEPPAGAFTQSTAHFVSQLVVGYDYVVLPWLSVGPRLWIEGPDLFGLGGQVATTFRI